MTRRLCLFELALCLTLASGFAPAEEKITLPFQGRVTATWDNVFNALFSPPAHFTGGGPVTHMGDTIQSGILTLSFPDQNGFAPGYGSVTIVAANGDSVSFDFQGILNASTGEGVGAFTFTGGTGRFAGATGQGTFDALIDLSVPTAQAMTVTLTGEISY
jgi:hypothetical protein